MAINNEKFLTDEFESDEHSKWKRQEYEYFLVVAKSILQGKSIKEEDRNRVAKMASNSTWFYKHLISPYELLGVEPSRKYAEAVKVHDIEHDDSEFDEDMEFDEDENSDSSYDNFCSSKHHLLAKNLWEGNMVPDSCYFNQFDYEAAMDIVLESEVVTFKDLRKYVQIAERIVCLFKDNVHGIRDICRMLGDAYYALEQYDAALAVYKNLFYSYKGACLSKDVLISKILYIKFKVGFEVEAQDLMMLKQPSDYNLTHSNFISLLSQSNTYLNVLLDGLLSVKRPLSEIIGNCFGDCSYEFFYRAFSNSHFPIQKILVEEGKDLRIPNIVPNNALQDILDVLFVELKFLGQQLKNIKRIQDDYVEETKLYNQLIKTFPRENIIHHYHPSWMWRYQFAIYFPELNLAFDYRGCQTRCADNYTPQSGGMEEYLRLYDKTLKKARDQYGIHVELIDETTSYDKIVSIITLHGGIQNKEVRDDNTCNIIVCSHCGGELQAIPNLLEGQRILCPLCESKFIYRKS